MKDRNNRDRRDFQRGRQRRGRRKVCMLCAEKVDRIDYKDLNRLSKMISENGKILPRRMTGTCARHQRYITTAVKRARQVALLPYTDA
ncbi:MAG: 30S ribosomal protein S18 [Clostridiaceae bacterium]|jgi:small subunit ribosomal protein S18|nr:30S ribosomal protein S18 [Clostridiaceae bacterium]HZW97243.1 30S ribosomal protein S18 [Bacillota bacterium]